MTRSRTLLAFMPRLEPSGAFPKISGTYQSWPFPPDPKDPPSDNLRGVRLSRLPIFSPVANTGAFLRASSSKLPNPLSPFPRFTQSALLDAASLAGCAFRGLRTLLPPLFAFISLSVGCPAFEDFGGGPLILPSSKQRFLLFSRQRSGPRFLPQPDRSASYCPTLDGDSPDVVTPDPPRNLR